MTAQTLIVAPGAKIPFSNLSSRERKALEELISDCSNNSTQRTPNGQFISRLGEKRRVLWEQVDEHKARILSIVDSSYKLAG